mgnify:CR=1 FL=1
MSESSDVPAWAAPYVAACAANGITSGIGGGMYGAGQNVNAVQAALMMLKALGYFQYQDDFGVSIRRLYLGSVLVRGVYSDL